jgi:acetyl-CoA carboxylase carboxyl transferase subunit alpha
LAAGNTVLMFEHATYSVISPEGCASILWRDDPTQVPVAAEAMRITAQDLKALGLIDEIVPEPVGGAHRAPAVALASLGDAVGRALDALRGTSAEALRARRREKFLGMGKLALG